MESKTNTFKKAAHLHVVMLPEQNRRFDYGQECHLIATDSESALGGRLVRMIAGAQPEPSISEIQSICDKWNAADGEYSFAPGMYIETGSIPA